VIKLILAFVLVCSAIQFLAMMGYVILGLALPARLAQARSNEVVMQSDYLTARTARDRAKGMTLKNNNIVLDDAFRGKIARPPSPLPAELK
jgi:hypothetical protein